MRGGRIVVWVVAGVMGGGVGVLLAVVALHSGHDAIQLVY